MSIMAESTRNLQRSSAVILTYACKMADEFLDWLVAKMLLINGSYMCRVPGPSAATSHKALVVPPLCVEPRTTRRRWQGEWKFYEAHGMFRMGWC